MTIQSMGHLKDTPRREKIEMNSDGGMEKLKIVVSVSKL